MEIPLASSEQAQPVTYRLIYLAPNQYSDEKITVGIALVEGNDLATFFVSSQYASDTLNTLYGKEFVESFQFGIQYLRSELSKNGAAIVSNLSLDMFSFGAENTAICENKNLFARDILELSSSLYRASPFKARTSKFLGQEEFSTELYDAVSIVDPLLATQLFKGTSIEISSKKLSIPIYGNRIIGAPVSLVTKMVEDATIKAEAYIARLNYARGVLNRAPHIYALLPAYDMDVNHELIRNSVQELQTVAEANESSIRVSDDIDELAFLMSKDERVGLH